MNKNKSVKKENTFDGSPGGSSGAINYSTGWGTPSSPSTTQYPDRFYQLQKNTADQQTGGPAGGQSPVANQPQQDQLKTGVDQMFKKKDTPSPDEVASGLQYELGRMITKDKSTAKQTVINNMKKDPHYYSNLHMLNIDDKKMDMSENSKGINKKELSKIFKEMADDIPKKYETKPEISSIMKDMWRRKEDRNLWKRGLTSEAPNE